MRSKTVVVVLVSVLILSASAHFYFSLVYAPSLRADSHLVRLYFANRDATRVIPEERIIPGDVTGELIIQELINGPTNVELIATLPPGTRLLSFGVEDGVAHVNLSGEAVLNHIGGTASELMLIYSVIASLTELPDITRVQFLIEGEIEPAIWGHVDTSAPLAPDDQFIAR